MGPSKQNLFLFFEENESQCCIDRKLVLLYANRCIIEEDAQFEICGVYQLQQVSESMLLSSDPLYKMHAKQRTTKEANDRDTISKAFENAYLSQSNSIDTHFIIGSLFHSQGGYWPMVRNRTSKIKEWMLNELNYQEIKSVYVSILTGHRFNLINKEMSKIAYKGKIVIDLTRTYSTVGKPLKVETKCSVNDDFELSISLIQHGRRLQQEIRSFLHPMITPHQMKLLKMKNDSFLRSFSVHRGSYGGDLCYAEWFAFPGKTDSCIPDSDPNVRFVNCLCFRSSFYLK